MPHQARANSSSARAAFRKQLELGREIEVIDSSTGERITGGDYPDDDEPEYD